MKHAPNQVSHPVKDGSSKGGVLLRQYGLVVLVFLLATLLTRASFMGDTIDYGDSIASFEQGHIYHFWDSGHLLWRPLGWVAFRVLNPITKRWVGPDVRSNSIVQLIALNMLAGLLCIILLHAILIRFRVRWRAASIVTIGFIFTYGFLNYYRTGCSYVPGLAAVLLSFYFLTIHEQAPAPSPGIAVLAGIALACAVCFWAAYLWVVPAVLLYPVLVFGSNKRQWRLTLAGATAAATFAVLLAGAVALHLRIHSFSALKDWIASASHGITYGGFWRMAFGFVGSWIDMGDDGLSFKRYLYHDPFNPVSLLDLFRLSLWKLMLFYATLGSLLLSLARSALGKRLLLLLALNAIPVLGFAVYFTGGQPERYLGLYPVFFLVLACVLDGEESSRGAKIVVLVFVLAVVISNLRALSKAKLQREQQAFQAELDVLRPHLNIHDIVLVPTHSKLPNFRRDYPLNLELQKIRVNEIFILGGKETAGWQAATASRLLSTWANGGDVWISTCLLSSLPGPQCDWVEGEDRRVLWRDVYGFFSQLETAESAAGRFVFLLPSPNNKAILRNLNGVPR